MKDANGAEMPCPTPAAIAAFPRLPPDLVEFFARRLAAQLLVPARFFAAEGGSYAGAGAALAQFKLRHVCRRPAGEP